MKNLVVILFVFNLMGCNEVSNDPKLKIDSTAMTKYHEKVKRTNDSLDQINLLQQKEKLAKSVKKLRIKIDDVENTTWYYDKNTTPYNNENSFHIYIGQKKDSKPWLRFRIQYTGSEWLFIEKYIVKADTSTFIINTKYGEVERDNKNGAVWEWYDINMDNDNYTIIKNIISSRTIKLRYSGKHYYFDRVINSTEKKGLQNILDAYEAMGGSLNFE